MPLAPGTQLGRFKVLAVLGEGGMGTVYRAVDEVLGRAVALKVLHDSASAEGASSGESKLLREARAAAALNHPNAVNVFDVGEGDGVAYIAMELLSGKSLRAYVGDASVPLARRLGWLVDAASALDAAHRSGLVHRDVKPDNVFVRDDGVVKVLDFGIARRVTSPVDPTAATVAGASLGTVTNAGGATLGGRLAGTPLYMAPEQMRGEEIDGAADQFSWAVTAYELLTGESPWDATRGSLQLVAQILSHRPDPPSARNPEVSPAVDAAILRALSKSPADRFPSMADAVAALGLEPTGESEAARAGAVGRWPLALALMLLATALSIAFVARRPDGGAPRAAVRSAPPAASASSGPLGYGSTLSSNERASAAYRAGMQAMVDGSETTASRRFEEAAELDPAFAAAHLRRALLTLSFADEEGREYLQKAFDLRSGLGAHDLALLEALGAAFAKPIDREGLDRKLAALESSDDADSLYAACRLRRVPLSDPEGAIRDCRAAEERDPQHAGAHQAEAWALIDQHEVDGARRAAEACIGISPGATDCLKILLDLALIAGRCDEGVALARKLVSLEPDRAAWRKRLFFALYGSGAPRESYEDALEQTFARMDGTDLLIERAKIRFELAVLRGDFGDARARLDEWDAAAASEESEMPDHFLVFHQSWLLLREIGQSDAAARLAESYAKRRGAWDTYGDMAGGEVLASLYASGRITREDYVRKRDVWLASQPASPVTWMGTYGVAQRSPDDARDALAAMARFVPPGAGEENMFQGVYGETLVRAGRPAEAAPALRRATAACSVYAWPIEQVHAYADLGAALAATGDVRGACTAFAAVLDRWGRARPWSVTAAGAQRQWTRLACPTLGLAAVSDGR
jgi:serine/threonine-protein kinase